MLPLASDVSQPKLQLLYLSNLSVIIYLAFYQLKPQRTIVYDLFFQISMPNFKKAINVACASIAAHI